MLALWTGLVFAGVVATTPASAVVTEVGGAKIGLQPRETARYWEGYWKWNGLGKDEAEANAPVLQFNNDPARPGHPGPVMHSVATYAVYWDPDDYYHGDWQRLIDGFLANAGAAGGQLSNVFAVDGQYTDLTNQPATDHATFHGAYTDTNPYPANEGCVDPHPMLTGTPLLEGETVCLTDRQIRAQLEVFIGEQHGIQKGMGAIFYLMTPPGVTVCLDGGGPNGRCSDFSGEIKEISEYEESKNSYPERLEAYDKENEAYESELKAYNKEKAEKEAKGETEEEEPPIAPTKPTVPVLPASYADFTKSFCSYHSDISSNPESGDANTVLYAVIPWTAGGEGDYHLEKRDQSQAFDCQDGGFEPATKPHGELQEKERAKKHSLKEEEEFRNKSAKEQREEEEAKELGLEAPHEQEPNQLASVRGPDGTYDGALADLIVNQIAVEQQNTVTDPLLNAWQDPAGREVTDECRNSFFATGGGGASANPLTGAGTLSNQALNDGSYYLNDAFNLASGLLQYPGVPCMNNVSLEPYFTAPNPVNVGEIVGFDGMESDVTLDAAVGFTPSGIVKPRYATYTWNFGDGTAPVTGYAPGAPTANSPAASPCPTWEPICAASTYHSYQYGGTYEVTLTITDVAGNTASIKKPITVDGPPPPAPEPAPAGGAANPASTTSGSAPSSGAPAAAPAATPTIPAPVVTGIAATTSLKKALSKGLPVHYTANEQVAGSIEVLLESSVAKRLGIHGSTATGLPTGTPSSIVVGTAVLITTKAGQGTLHIKFSSRTSARLKHVRKLKLMLRLFARNASRQSPQTTTMLSTVVLNP
ncbi:MAG: PKD domain-containing protein [Solirubrobacteraceae bacterium]